MRRALVVLLGLCALGGLVAPPLPAAWRHTERVAEPNSERMRRGSPTVIFDHRGGALAYWDLTDRRARRHTLERAYRPPVGRWRALPRLPAVGNARILPNGGTSIVGLIAARPSARVPVTARLEAVYAPRPDARFVRQTLAGRAEVFPSALAANRHGDAAAVFQRDDSMWVALRRDGGRFMRAARVSTAPTDTFEAQAAINERGDVLVAWVGDGRVLASWRRARDDSFTPPADLGATGDVERYLAMDVGESGDAIVAWNDEYGVGEFEEEVPGRLWAAAGSLRRGFARARLLAPRRARASDPTAAFDSTGRGVVAWVTRGGVDTARVDDRRVVSGPRLRGRSVSPSFPRMVAARDGSLWLEADGHVTQRAPGASAFGPLRFATADAEDLAVDPLTGSPAIVRRREICPCEVAGRDVTVIEVVRP